jgi:hypothetical protein
MKTEEQNKISDEQIDNLFVSPTEGEIIDGTEEEGDEKDSLVHNSADADQVKKAETKLENRERQERSDLLWILSDIRGRRFLWKILERTRPYASTFHPDSNSQYFELGRRNEGSALLGEILNADSTAFGKLMTEFKGEVNGNRKRKRS